MALPTLSQLTDVARSSARSLGVDLSDAGSAARQVTDHSESTLGARRCRRPTSTSRRRPGRRGGCGLAIGSGARARGGHPGARASELRANKHDLAVLVSIETGKILSEGLGEVQEMIDICDLAVGLSRQLHGLTIASERPDHRLSETWHPIGPIGVISAFNFPVAVWSWNAALAIVCGDPVVWKPSDKTMLSSVATLALARRAAARVRRARRPVRAGCRADPTRRWRSPPIDDLALISATGSTAMGAAVGPVVTARFGRTLLELGGNNAAIIAPSSDIELVVRGVTFSAAGTAGQRCTTLRRLIVHRSRLDEVTDRLARTYESLPIGDPLADGTLVGPVIDRSAGERLRAAMRAARVRRR